MSAPPTSRFDGKVALITGSGRGMGAHNALEVAGQGCSVVINYYRAGDRAEKLVQKIKTEHKQDSIAIKADVGNPEEVKMLFDKALAHFKHIDIVVSNSGLESFGHISEITPEEFDRVFRVKIRGQLFVA